MEHSAHHDHGSCGVGQPAATTPSANQGASQPLNHAVSHAPDSPWLPLRHRVFRGLWVTGVIGNIGVWMHDVGAGWLMTTMDPSPLMVSLVQAAGTLPILFLALPAGALADVVDRRKLLIAVQIGVVLLGALLAILTLTGGVTPLALLAITLGLGVATALTNPAWQTVMTELVSREELAQASALNSVSLNLSRAIGPALGGFIVAATSPALVFVLRAFSVLGIIGVLSFWRYTRPVSAAPGERFFGALRAGVRYVRHSHLMRSVLVRTAGFVLFATSLWALMPLIAKEQLGTGALGYGVLLACLGAGAVTTAALMPRLRRRFSTNQLVFGATLLYAGALAGIALTSSTLVAYPLMVLAGGAWVTCVVCLNVSVQAGVPMWVRARALACYLATFFGSMAIASPLWGALAERYSIPIALLVSSAGMVLALGALLRVRLAPVSREDVDRSPHWEDPVVATEVRPDDGPVVVTIEYNVASENAEAFQAAMGPVATTRYRDGATTWLLTRDTEKPERWLEVFIVESWAEHLRQHGRTTLADRRVQEHARSFNVGGPPIVAHHVAAPVKPVHAPVDDERA
ncbi:MAG: MFS transporter [Planctomycetota bacterium]|nr:MFS transporter [Planctomycetota bacterium]